MKNNAVKTCCKQGFTLIELLVVVLIIGILAAVALPQYQKSVNKSRGTEALNIMQAANEAVSAYYLEHGTYEGLTADSLSINIPEAKYFGYQVGSDCSSSQSSSSTFQGYNGDDNGTSMQKFEVLLCLPNSDMSVKSIWNSGKLVYRGCKNPNCDKYFNCSRWGARNGYAINFCYWD